MTTAVLELPVLILNSRWVPIRVEPVMSALTKLYEGVAKAVKAEDYSVYDFDSWTELALTKDEPCIHTAHLTFKVPDVIVLCRYGEIPDKKLAFSRANIYKRDRYTCMYCGAQPGTEELTIDHILPKSRGGKSEWTNCILACITCNRRKADKTLQEAGMRLRHKPTKPDWSPRMVISKVKNTPENWKRFIDEAYWNCNLQE